MSDTASTTPKVRLDDTVRMPDATGSSAIGGIESRLASSRETAFETQGATALKVIEIDRLYEAPAESPSQMLRALELLKQASDFLGQAQKSADAMEADRFVQRVQASLPKLFACRSVGDGFGLLINSIYYAFVNLRGNPLSQEQVRVMWRVLRELRARPAMSADQGIERVAELEGAGLVVDPPDIGELVEDFEATQDE